MSDEENQEETPVDVVDEPAAPPAAEPDPRDAKIAQLEAQMRALAGQLQPPLKPDVEPDFSDAENYGFTPAQAKYVHSKTAAWQAAREAATQKPESRRTFFELRDEAADSLGCDVTREFTGLAVEKVHELEAQGVDLQSEKGVRKFVSVMRKALPKAAPTPPREDRTAGIGGPSLPPGRSAAKPEPKPETWVETIKKDQRKRGLYYY